MTLPAIPDSAIVLRAHAADWRAAIGAAGAALTASGFATEEYADQMERMVDEHGPYIVIAPGLALAHARPGPAVLADGIAVVTLAEAVPFGHPHNDPVRVVLAVAVTTAARHLQIVADLANVFNDSDAVDRIADAESADAVRAILEAA